MNEQKNKKLLGLPQSVLDQLKGSKNKSINEKRHSPTKKKMLAILKDKPLQLDDVIIAFYKEHKKIMKRSSATQIMHTLKCCGFIETKGRMMDRFYAITDEGKEYFKNAKPKKAPGKCLPKSKKSICEVDVSNTILDPFTPITMEEAISNAKIKGSGGWYNIKDMGPFFMTDQELIEATKSEKQKEFPKKSWLPRFLRPQSDH